MANSVAKGEPLTIKDATNPLSNGFGLLFNKLKDNDKTKAVLNETFAKVEQAKQQWESTADALPELICIIDANGRILRTNRTIEKWGLGNVKNVKEQNYHNLLHPHCEQPCYLYNAIHQTINYTSIEESGFEQEVYDQTLQRFVSLCIRPVIMNSNNAANHRNWVVILKDISTRKWAEQALHRQNGRLVILNAINKAILAADSPEAIAQAALNRIQALVPYQYAHLLVKIPETNQLLVLAAIGKNIETNLKSGEKILQTSINQNKERTCDKFYIAQSLGHLSKRTKIEEAWLAQGLNSYMNVPLVASNHNIGTLQLAANNPAVFKPEQIEVVREIAETLTIAIQQSQLHQKLERTNDELRRILRTKHEIMQDISHDLRSPLALVQGYAEMLKDGLLGPLTDDQFHALKVIDKKGEQLLTLVNRLFSLHTVGQDTLNKTPFNLNHHLQETVQSWQILAANKNIRLQLEIPSELPIIMADSDLLDQVLTNLLDNALKFSSENSKITIRAWEEAREVIVAITDLGKGIEPEKISQVFERYYQVKVNSQAKSGAGIGLALCKAIVDAHNGRIWAESAGQNQGATFFISFPIT